MNPFTIFFPFVLFFSGATVLVFVSAPFVVIAGGMLAILLYTDWKSKNKTVEHKYILGMNRQRMTTLLTILCSILAFACYSLLFLSCNGLWLRAKPTADWKNRVQNADTANRFLLDWTLKNTAARILLVQEGIWLAANEKEAAGRKGNDREMVRLHAHSENNCVNTMQAAYFVFKKISELGKSKAILVAHDLQLQRACRDIVKIKKTRQEWKNIEIIVPYIPKTPFPAASIQWHTRGRLRYKFVELFWSRPRDYLASTRSYR